MTYLPFIVCFLLICIPLWVIAILMYRAYKDLAIIFSVKEKKVLLEKKAVVPDNFVDVDMKGINERLDRAMANRAVPDEAVESHVNGLGKEVSIELEDSGNAIAKLKRLGK